MAEINAINDTIYSVMLMENLLDEPQVKYKTILFDDHANAIETINGRDVPKNLRYYSIKIQFLLTFSTLFDEMSRQA